MLRKKIIAAVVAASFSTVTSASVYNEMQSWFNDMGVYGNVTGPQVIKGQTGTTFSGGSLYMRTPVRNYQIIGFTPPTLRGGCGGIDVHAGSFSFINAEAFTALLQNIGNAAIGAAFMMAVKSVSPELAGVLESLQSFAQAANNALGNSCRLGQIAAEAGAALVGKMVGKENSHSTGEFAKALNTAKDSLDQATKFINDKMYRAQNTNAAKNIDTGMKEILESKNVAFYALRGTNVSDEMAELMMSLTGTMILLGSDKGTNKTPEVKVIEGTLTYDQFVGSPDSEKTKVKLLKCLDNMVDRFGCLNVSSPIDTEIMSFIYRIKKLIKDGSIKVAARSPISFADSIDQSIYLNSPVPLWKMVASSAYGGMALLDAETHAEMIAHQITRGYLINVSMEMKKALANVKGSQDEANVEGAEKLSQRLSEFIRSSETAYQSSMQKVAAVAQAQKNVQWLYQSLLNSMPKETTQALLFSKK